MFLLLAFSNRAFDNNFTPNSLLMHPYLDFAVVRMAAVQSLRALSVSRPVFAASAVNFLVDMFNDDAHDVCRYFL